VRNGQRWRLSALLLLLGSIGVPGTIGCAHRAVTTTVTPAQVQQSQQRHESAQQFLTALQGVAPDQRETYIQAHPTEAKVAFQTEDPGIRSQLLQAMNER